MNERAPSPWTPDLDAHLAQRWNDPNQPSTARIGRELGVSKNAVIGRARRLGLPKRASPLRGGPRKGPQRLCHDGRVGGRGTLVTGCKFIAGDPHGCFARGENPFCGKPPLRGSAYCAEHHPICYTLATPTRIAEIDRVADRAVREAEAA